MLDKDTLLALARANFTPVEEKTVDFHVAGLAQTNRLVAEAAVKRLSIDQPPQSYDGLRVQYANESKARR